MDKLREYFQEELENIQVHITTNLKSSLSNAVQRLHVKQRDTFVEIERKLDVSLKRQKKPSKFPKHNNLPNNISPKHDKLSREENRVQHGRKHNLKESFGESNLDGDSNGDSQGCSEGGSYGHSVLSDGDDETDIEKDGIGYEFFSNGDRDEDDCPPGCRCYACSMNIGYHKSIRRDDCRFEKRKRLNVEEGDRDNESNLDGNSETGYNLNSSNPKYNREGYGYGDGCLINEGTYGYDGYATDGNNSDAGCSDKSGGYGSSYSNEGGFSGGGNSQGDY